jgi:hypothetical protein
MRLPIRCGITAVALFAGANAANAQVTSWSDRARVSINGGTQPASTTFSSTTSSPLYQENSTFNTTYTVPTGPLFDGGLLVRVKGNFGVGFALSSFNKGKDASVAGSIPHPFFFNTPRNINGTAGSLERTEFAAHIQAAYVFPLRRFDVVVSGGPTFFNVKQDLVSGATFTETYPYDTAAFGTATTTKATGTKLGFNAGADVGVRLSSNFGVGALLRFSRANLTLPLTGSSSGVSVDAGGLQVGGGVRFYF